MFFLNCLFFVFAIVTFKHWVISITLETTLCILVEVASMYFVADLSAKYYFYMVSYKMKVV